MPSKNSRPSKSIEQDLRHKEKVMLLRQTRLDLRITQAELAHRIGCAESLVHKWETFKRRPSDFMFECWSQALEQGEAT